ncbi:MAG TPA: GNAT family N-acetyltransferase [Pyrinomonadaceae bacterium]|jgi:phosphinothricin acetyltransferase|nr:GNAT family N-acetyltransferase [Pyrinomonadaceae bacterium]
MNIRPAILTDASQIAEIYNHYILTSHCTFEISPIDPAEMGPRISDSLDHGFPFLVAELESNIVGYAYARQFRPRPAYRHSAEISVYIRNGSEGRSIGTALYERLFDAISKLDLHAVIAGIALPNDASIRLHEKFGFEKVAHFREVGFKFGKWIDVGYWQLNKNLPI